MLIHVIGTGGDRMLPVPVTRDSNKPVIRLKAIRERKNSLRSDNILSRINAAPRALTISNSLPQSPSASYPRQSRKVHQRGCIRLIFCIHPIRKYLPDNHEVYYKASRRGCTLSTKFRALPVCMSVCCRMTLRWKKRLPIG